MKDGLLERIKNFGYWRVNIRPLSPIPEKLSLKRCHEVVDAARVSIRGWDFPHMSPREDEHGGSLRVGEYFEHWCDWDVYIEFWRMYRSGQFLSYKAVKEDVRGEDGRPPAERHLRTVSAIYSVTEFVEFAHRLFANDLYPEGASINLSLRGNAGRQLLAGDGRVPFFDAKRSDAPSIEIERSMKPSVLKSEHRDVSIDMLLELFDHFGWNPDPAQIQADQEQFYRRDFR